MNSVLNWLILHVLWWTLQAWEACNPEALPQCARVLIKPDFTVVIWPIRDERILWRLRATARMNTVKLSTLLSSLWKLLRLAVTRGSSGAAAGTRPTPSTSNSPAHQSARGNGATLHNKIQGSS